MSKPFSFNIYKDKLNKIFRISENILSGKIESIRFHKSFDELQHFPMFIDHCDDNYIKLKSIAERNLEATAMVNLISISIYNFSTNNFFLMDRDLELSDEVAAFFLNNNFVIQYKDKEMGIKWYDKRAILRRQTIKEIIE